MPKDFLVFMDFLFAKRRKLSLRMQTRSVRHSFSFDNRSIYLLQTFRVSKGREARVYCWWHGCLTFIR